MLGLSKSCPFALLALRNGRWADVTFSDAGPGIASEHQARVFERFYRVDGARTREKGGFGLRLAIAKWAVDAHDGSLTLESAVGEGSTFRIRLPLET